MPVTLDKNDHEIGMDRKKYCTCYAPQHQSNRNFRIHLQRRCKAKEVGNRYLRIVFSKQNCIEKGDSSLEGQKRKSWKDVDLMRKSKKRIRACPDRRSLDVITNIDKR